MRRDPCIAHGHAQAVQQRGRHGQCQRRLQAPGLARVARSAAAASDRGSDTSPTAPPAPAAAQRRGQPCAASAGPGRPRPRPRRPRRTARVRLPTWASAAASGQPLMSSNAAAPGSAPRWPGWRRTGAAARSHCPARPETRRRPPPVRPARAPSAQRQPVGPGQQPPAAARRRRSGWPAAGRPAPAPAASRRPGRRSGLR